jgi:hypothetical protein
MKDLMNNIVNSRMQEIIPGKLKKQLLTKRISQKAPIHEMESNSQSAY